MWAIQPVWASDADSLRNTWNAKCQKWPVQILQVCFKRLTQMGRRNSKNCAFITLEHPTPGVLDRVLQGPSSLWPNPIKNNPLCWLTPSKITTAQQMTAGCSSGPLSIWRPTHRPDRQKHWDTAECDTDILPKRPNVDEDSEYGYNQTDPVLTALSWR